jgi:hypothetical protein
MREKLSELINQAVTSREQNLIPVQLQKQDVHAEDREPALFDQYGTHASLRND